MYLLISCYSITHRKQKQNTHGKIISEQLRSRIPASEILAHPYMQAVLIHIFLADSTISLCFVKRSCVRLRPQGHLPSAHLSNGIFCRVQDGAADRASAEFPAHGKPPDHICTPLLGPKETTDGKRRIALISNDMTCTFINLVKLIRKALLPHKTSSRIAAASSGREADTLKCIIGLIPLTWFPSRYKIS